MSLIPPLTHKVIYQGSDGSALWEGRLVEDQDAFRSYMRDVVRARVNDAEERDALEAELRALSTTGMATEYLERLLREVPEPKDWEVGEALADCVVRQDSVREVCLPWNTVRDRRTPRASLPGADLVGFCRQNGEVLLLLGEVKTSSDASTPPNVMYGTGGMTWQLEENATRLAIQHALLRWLLCRCVSPEHRGLYREAVSRYLASQGKAILLFGVLLRDTSPDERDVRSRAETLAQKLPSPTRIEVYAWYLPVRVTNWPALIQRGTS